LIIGGDFTFEQLYIHNPHCRNIKSLLFAEVSNFVFLPGMT